jgi:hypothetical protein
MERDERESNLEGWNASKRNAEFKSFASKTLTFGS